MKKIFISGDRLLEFDTESRIVTELEEAVVSGGVAEASVEDIKAPAQEADVAMPAPEQKKRAYRKTGKKFKKPKKAKYGRTIAEIDRNSADIPKKLKERIKDLREEDKTSTEIADELDIDVEIVRRVPARTELEMKKQKGPAAGKMGKSEHIRNLLLSGETDTETIANKAGATTNLVYMVKAVMKKKGLLPQKETVPKTIPHETRERIRQLRSEGNTPLEISDLLSLSIGDVNEILADRRGSRFISSDKDSDAEKIGAMYEEGSDTDDIMLAFPHLTERQVQEKISWYQRNKQAA